MAVSESVDRFNGTVQGLAVKAPCVAVATSDITLSGEQTIGGIAVVAGDRVLVTGQTSSIDNGIYDVDSSAWKRSADFDGNRDVVQGTLIIVYDTVANGVTYQVTSSNPITIGTDAITIVLRDFPLITYPQTAAEISAGVTPTNLQFTVSPVVDPRRYVLVGDSITDDFGALQDAIDVAGFAVNGGVLVPPNTAGKTFLCLSELIISKPITFKGSGRLSTTISGTGLTGTNLLHVDGTINPNLEDVKIADLTLMSNDGGSDLLRVNRCSLSRFWNLGLRSGVNGVLITGNRTFNNDYNLFSTATAQSLTAVRFDAFTGGGIHNFYSGTLNGNRGMRITSDSEIAMLNLFGVGFEGCTQEGFLCEGTLLGCNMSGIYVENCKAFVNIAFRPAVGKVVRGVNITGARFDAVNVSTWAIEFGGADCEGFSVTACRASRYITGFVRFNGAGENGQVLGNQVGDLGSIVSTVRPGVLVLNNVNDSGALGPQWAPPLTTPAYTETNVVTDRAFDANAAAGAITSPPTQAEVENIRDAILELADVVGTLIVDLRAIGHIK